MATVRCKGENAHPVYRFLAAVWGGAAPELRSPTFGNRIGNAVLGASVKWNFTKFLVGADGIPVQRWGPLSSPGKIRKPAEALIARVRAAAAAGGDDEGEPEAEEKAVTKQRTVKGNKR